MGTRGRQGNKRQVSGKGGWVSGKGDERWVGGQGDERWVGEQGG